MLVVDGLSITFNFGLFFIVTAVGAVYIYVRVKETDSLSKDQVKDLYRASEDRLILGSLLFSQENASSMLPLSLTNSSDTYNE